MKAGIHPEYTTCEVVCACGSKFETRSVRNQIKVDICSECHPFYTGNQKFVDTAGRVDKFRKRYAKKAGEPDADATTEPASSDSGSSDS